MCREAGSRYQRKLSKPLMFTCLTAAAFSVRINGPAQRTRHQYLRSGVKPAEDQKIRADDLAITMEAYRLALEDQFVRSQGAIEELFRALQTDKKAVNANSRSKPVVERMSSVHYEILAGQPVDRVADTRQLLVRWIESTLLSAISAAGIPVSDCKSEGHVEDVCSCDDDADPRPASSICQRSESPKSVSSLVTSSKFKSVESLSDRASMPTGATFTPQYKKQSAPTGS
ncbi:unnamed protein product [Schistocephalus solidus]|uniref:Uncharacterized protein n=1 Tax=Schistocephalus solidus TaxID=70667 RepID=A0A183T4L9_SCHSO|nr:unnamed protein product [Schistocephalus solidus]